MRLKNLNAYSASLIFRKDGVVISEKTLPAINLQAGKDSIINISKYLPKIEPGSEYLADIHFRLSKDELWASKGFQVASNQFALNKPATAKSTERIESPKYNSTADLDIYTGANFEIGISKQNGALVSYKWKGQQQIFAALLPHFTRPLTDNDKRGWKSNKKLRQWYQNDLKFISSSASKFEGPSGAALKISSTYSLINDSAKVIVSYFIANTGTVKVNYELEVKPGLPNIPKVGMQMGVLRNNDHISWYGRGPMENYIDKRYGFDAAIYNQPLNDFMEHYAVPQENGNRTDVRWMFFSNPKNKQGIAFVADSLLSMSASPYTDENVQSAKHTNKLKDAGYLTVNIDLIQMGVGGNDSWSDVAAPLAQYQIPSKNYKYSFYLLPFEGKTEELINKVKRIKF